LLCCAYLCKVFNSYLYYFYFYFYFYYYYDYYGIGNKGEGDHSGYCGTVLVEVGAVLFILEAENDIVRRKSGPHHTAM